MKENLISIITAFCMLGYIAISGLIMQNQFAIIKEQKSQLNLQKIKLDELNKYPDWSTSAHNVCNVPEKFLQGCITYEID